MNPNVESVLNRAFDLIEAGQLDDARILLRPILETEKDNPDIWWLYAHSVTDKETARLALNNVLRIDKSYPDARDLLQQIEESSASQQYTDAELEKEPPFIPALPASLPGLSTSVSARNTAIAGDYQDDVFDENQPDVFYRRPWFYVPLIILLLLAALAIVLLKPFASNAPELTGTTSALLTNEGTPTTEAFSTGLPQSAESTGTSVIEIQGSPNELSESDIASLKSDLSQYKVSDSDFSTVSTSLGTSLVLSICTTSGRELRELLPHVINSLAKSSKTYSAKVQAISVRMIDCTDNSVLRWIGTSIGDAVSYSDGTLTQTDFESRWTPIKEQ